VVVSMHQDADHLISSLQATNGVLMRDGGVIYNEFDRRAKRLRRGLELLLQAKGHPAVTNGAGAIFHFSFLRTPPRNYRETRAADASLYSDFALALLDEGILVLPDGRWYLSADHSDEDIEATLAAAERALG